MTYTKQEVANKIKELGDKIHEIDTIKKRQIEEHRNDIHFYIEHSDMTYEEAYSIVRDTYKKDVEFYPAMGRIRETIIRRDNG